MKYLTSTILTILLLQLAVPAHLLAETITRATDETSISTTKPALGYPSKKVLPSQLPCRTVLRPTGAAVIECPGDTVTQTASDFGAGGVSSAKGWDGIYYAKTVTGTTTVTNTGTGTYNAGVGTVSVTGSATATDTYQATFGGVTYTFTASATGTGTKTVTATRTQYYPLGGNRTITYSATGTYTGANGAYGTASSTWSQTVTYTATATATATTTATNSSTFTAAGMPETGSASGTWSQTNTQTGTMSATTTTSATATSIGTLTTTATSTALESEVIIGLNSTKYVPVTRGVCGQALSADVTCTATDVGAVPNTASINAGTGLALRVPPSTVTTVGIHIDQSPQIMLTQKVYASAGLALKTDATTSTYTSADLTANATMVLTGTATATASVTNVLYAGTGIGFQNGTSTTASASVASNPTIVNTNTSTGTVTNTINGHPVSSNPTLTPSDVGAAPASVKVFKGGYDTTASGSTGTDGAAVVVASHTIVTTSNNEDIMVDATAVAYSTGGSSYGCYLYVQCDYSTVGQSNAKWDYNSGNTAFSFAISKGCYGLAAGTHYITLNAQAGGGNVCAVTSGDLRVQRFGAN